MKARESGMPDEAMWRMFFNPIEIFTRLGLRRNTQNLVDFGCGYGTFTIPAAQFIEGAVHGLDIEPDMIEETMLKAKRAGLTNVSLHQCDFMAEGTGLPDSMADYVMMFNILHTEQPLQLLRESLRIMRPGATMGIMHWNYDPRTPRGPAMDIRPKPEDCLSWARTAGFAITVEHIDLPPYHYGIIARKGIAQ